LFKTGNFGSKITRACIGSSYDHVAMIVWFESNPDEVFYVDATGY
jgi:hypothetical protein